MSFKVTIINNDNGEVIVNEENACAVIGAVGTDEAAHCLGFTECNIIQLVQAIEGAQKATKNLIENTPLLATFLKFKEVISHAEEQRE